MRTIVICALFVLLAFANAETLAKARLRGINALEKDIRSESAFLSVRVLPNILTSHSLRRLPLERISSP